MRKTIGALCLLALAGCSDDEDPGSGSGGSGGSGGMAGAAGMAGSAGATDPCNLPVLNIPTPKNHTPRWAFEPWISKDISDADDTRQFVGGFKSRNIPVGVVVIDSPWETQYNTFVPNPSRYPEFEQLVSELHAGEVRIVMWVTQMVNYFSSDLEPGGDTYEGKSPNFDEGDRCGFFVDESHTYNWWKGQGAGLDFFNPKAVAWWHAQQDPLLAMGIDGFKLDFGEEYLLNDPLSTAAGPISRQQYSEEYYRDFFAYGVHKKGAEEFVTMVRPYDKSYGFAGRFYAKKEHAPVGWVGDNRRDWIGLQDALDHIFRSAAAGYVMVGSDIGGYLDRDDNVLTELVPFDQDNFVRWTALGALTPFMQLHGRANLAPWTVPDKPSETVDIYRYWATLHHELVPFFYSLAEEAYAGAAPIIRPIGVEASWPDDYRFHLGDAFMVAPIVSAGGVRDVALPPGARYYDWWQPSAAPLDGGQTLTAYDASDQARIPLFVKEGAIVPLDVASDVTGVGDASFAGHLTLLAYPATTKSTFVLHDTDGQTTQVELVQTGSSVSLKLSRATQPVIVRVRRAAAPAGASLDGSALTARTSLSAALSGGGIYDDGVAFSYLVVPAKSGAFEIVLD